MLIARRATFVYPKIGIGLALNLVPFEPETFSVVEVNLAFKSLG
jgi:hypothetical protein